MTTYLYKSTTGKTITVGSYYVTSTPGLQFSEPIKILDTLVGNTLQRFTNGILDITDSSGSSILSTSTRTATVADADTIIKCTAAATITIPNDAIGGFSNSESNIIRTYQASTGVVSFSAGSGVTFRGTAKTPIQYVVQSLMRVSANEWVYL